MSLKQNRPPTGTSDVLRGRTSVGSFCPHCGGQLGIDVVAELSVKDDNALIEGIKRYRRERAPLDDILERQRKQTQRRESR